jgi:hypothetical protein
MRGNHCFGGVGVMAVAVDKTPNAPVDMVNRGVLAVL